VILIKHDDDDDYIAWPFGKRF